MKYSKNNATTGSASLISPAITGAVAGPFRAAPDFLPWQPSTWPTAPSKFNVDLVKTVKHIIDESTLGEIRNVIEDVLKSNGNLQHRGHVVAIALMCALDALSSYGYRGKHMAMFVRNHFPSDYRAHADSIYTLYRNSLVHNWNLFEVSIFPGNEGIQKTGDTLSFGLLHFFDALQTAANDFLNRLKTDTNLQTNTFNRYKELRKTAKP